jgi:heptose I phosphotransferase
MQDILETTEFINNIKPYLKAGNIFNTIMTVQGRVFRSVKGRKTLQIELSGNRYFIKQHFGVGWAEILKNLIVFRKPIIGAKTEKEAIQALDQIGIPTTPLIAFGEQGFNPANKQSFLITRDLGNIVSLEDFCRDWKEHPPNNKLRQQIVIAVVTLAKKLHQAGLIHRDFYLCHLCLDADLLQKGEIKLYLIDLHRMLMNQSIGGKGTMKDIAALYFSAMDVGLSPKDIELFQQNYCQDLPAKFWGDVGVRANKLYTKFHSAKFQQRLQVEKSALEP